MLLAQERDLLVLYGKKLVTHGLTKGTGGNLSIFNRKEQLVAITPSAIDYREAEPEDITVLAVDRKEIIEGSLKVSSELDMHMLLYKKRDDLSAIVHTHSAYATTLACLHWDIPPVHYLVGFAGKNVRCAEYATNTTEKLAENACSAMQDRMAVLLANHGLIAGGATLKEAFNTAEIIEYCAEVYYRAKCIGEPVVISDEEMERVLDTFKSYGQ